MTDDIMNCKDATSPIVNDYHPPRLFSLPGMIGANVILTTKEEAIIIGRERKRFFFEKEAITRSKQSNTIICAVFSFLNLA